MATKRKREEDDIEFSSASKLSKSAAEEVTRSGRVRKKPARFKDTEGMEGEEDETETTEDTKTPQSPVVIPMTPPKVIPIPVPITKTSTLPATIVTKLVTSPVKEVPQLTTTISPQTAKTLLQAKLLEMPKANILPPLPPPSHGSPGAATKAVPLQINPQSIQLPTLMVKTALQAKPAATIDVSPNTEMSDGTPKSGRVRKKSAKVLEMEAFEEAEKAKHTVKKGVIKPVTSPTTTPPKLTKLKPEEVQQKLILQKSLPITGVTSPVKVEQIEQVLNTVTVQQALLQLPVMKTESSPIKNIQDTVKTPISTKKTSKKRKVDSSPGLEGTQAAPAQIAVVPKVAAKTGTKPKEGTMITGLRSDVDPMLSTSFLPDPSAHLMVKDEPNDGVDLGLLSSETHNINMSAVQKTSVIKTETVTPAKKSKSKAKKLSTAAEAEVSLQEEGNKKASSVIKMLLSKPSQYSSPSVSTKSIASEKKSKQKVAMETELTVDTTVSQNSELKSKLILSSPDIEDDLYDDDEEEEMYAEEDLSPESTGKKKVKKVKKKSKPSKQADIEDDSIDGSEDWEFETADGNLVIAENVPKAKPKKSPKKAKSGGSDGYIDDSQVGYANSKKGKKTPPASTEKKKKRLTAYTMWCNTVRNKVLNDNPGIDFAQLSRRLGEIWQGLPSKDKMNWKRKAKREARKLLGKGLLITTGKGGSGVTSASQVHHSKSSTTASSSSSNVQSIQHHHQQQQQHTVAKALTFTKPEDSTIASSSKSVLGTEPVDVAAHLKLLGESLGIIGMRLQEHRGLIAVQGSLSVLLDSLLCAIGPLMCLTSQVSEMNGCSSETHARTLDHIAYIMPGL